MPTNQLNAAIYARVSTEFQQSNDLQLRIGCMYFHRLREILCDAHRTDWRNWTGSHLFLLSAVDFPRSRRERVLNLTMVHADTPDLLNNLSATVTRRRRWPFTYAPYEPACISRGGMCRCHIDCRTLLHPGIQKVSPLPVVDLISEVSHAVKARGLKRIGILGTRTVMETRFYRSIHTAEIIPPGGQDLDDVHDAYVEMASAGA